MVGTLRFAHPTRLLRAMTAEKTWLDILAARCARGLSNETLEKFRGRRENRMLTAPAASRANEKSTRASHHRYAETIRPSLRDGLRLIRDLTGVHDLLVTVACAMRDAHRRELGTSQGVPGPHDFAVRFFRIIRL